VARRDQQLRICLGSVAVLIALAAVGCGGALSSKDGAAGGGGGGGSGGNPASVSYFGCTGGAATLKVMIAKRDTAANQCLTLILEYSPSQAPQPTPGLDLPEGWVFAAVDRSAAALCPLPLGPALAVEVTGTVRWVDGLDMSHADVNLTLTFPANDAGPPSVERFEVQNLELIPGCGGANACHPVLAVRCGDRFNHHTAIEGREDMWSGYGRTARAESGRETVYTFSSANTCTVTANLTNLTVDLDLLLLSTCDPISGNEAASSTPLDLQTVETIRWINLPDQISYLVVDGYYGAAGSYTLEVDCTCQ
jgi:hypothetical protein